MTTRAGDLRRRKSSSTALTASHRTRSPPPPPLLRVGRSAAKPGSSNRGWGGTVGGGGGPWSAEQFSADQGAANTRHMGCACSKTAVPATSPVRVEKGNDWAAAASLERANREGRQRGGAQNCHHAEAGCPARPKQGPPPEGQVGIRPLGSVASHCRRPRPLQRWLPPGLAALRFSVAARRGASSAAHRGAAPTAASSCGGRLRRSSPPQLHQPCLHAGPRLLVAAQQRCALLAARNGAQLSAIAKIVASVAPRGRGPAVGARCEVLLARSVSKPSWVIASPGCPRQRQLEASSRDGQRGWPEAACRWRPCAASVGPGGPRPACDAHTRCHDRS